MPQPATVPSIVVTLLLLGMTVALSSPASAQGYGWNRDKGLGWGVRYAMKYPAVPPDYFTGTGTPVYAAAYTYADPYESRSAYGCLSSDRQCPSW